MKLNILIANLSLFFCVGLAMPAYALQPAEDALIELYQRVDELQQDLNTLRGQNQELKYTVDSLKKQQKEGFIELDDRFEQLSQKVGSTPDSPESSGDKAPNESTNKADSQPVSSNKANNDEESYKLAYALLKDDPYRAIVAFKDFLNKYPKSKLAANAQYWIGESYYSLEKYPEAKNRFLNVLKEYKGSSKEADAALKLGYTFFAMKEWSMARKTLEDVTKFFKGSREAELAQAKLASLEKAGH